MQIDQYPLLWYQWWWNELAAVFWDLGCGSYILNSSCRAELVFQSTACMLSVDYSTGLTAYTMQRCILDSEDRVQEV